jgi:hypothetical protein
MDLLEAGPPYPLDFRVHISYLLELSQSSSLSEMETFGLPNLRRQVARAQIIQGKTAAKELQAAAQGP